MNIKKLMFLSFSSLILINFCGCKNESQITDSVENSKNNIEQNIENIISDDQNIKTEISDNQNIVNNQNNLIENNDNDSNNNNNLSKDDIIKNYFNDAVNNINQFLNSDSVENAKEKCKEYFITFVDFIFYEGEIKGITFKEITDETKMHIINIVKSIDNTIMKKFPNYKETISEPVKDWYNTASELLHSGKEKISDYVIKEYGTEKYQEIVDNINSVKQNVSDTWENIKDFGSEKIDSGKEALNNWYQNFKNN